MLKANKLSFITCLFLSICTLAACTVEPPDPVSEPPVTQYITRGKILVKGLAACGFCHGTSTDPRALLSGGQVMQDTYGEVTVPNITPAESAIKNWTTIDIIKLFRSGQRPDETFISRDLHAGMEWMSDDDILSVVSYIKNVPAVENDIGRRSLSSLERNTTGFFETEKEVKGYVPDIEKSYQLEYGQYLADHVARCGTCHNTPATLLEEEKYLAGGAIIKNSNGEKTAPNISQSETAGIGSWSEEEIADYLRIGSIPGGREVDKGFCPVEFYMNALPEDIISLAKYLKSVPAA